MKVANVLSNDSNQLVINEWPEKAQLRLINHSGPVAGVAMLLLGGAGASTSAALLDL